MKKMLIVLALFTATAVFSQTNVPSMAVFNTLESYIIDNDTNYNGWTNNKVTVFESAVFSSVSGTPGESTLGNDLGLEVPIHKFGIHIDSVTRFQQLFGDVASQQFGIAYDMNIHQVQLSGGIDARYTFTGHEAEAVPYIEFKKASTSLYGTSPFVRYSFPIHKNPGAGEVDIGLSLSF